jgi:hypothetical protein
MLALHSRLIALLQTITAVYVASGTKKKKQVITHLEQVITRQREKINQFGNCSNCYFLFLVFLRNRYLLVFVPFSAARESDFSSRYFLYRWFFEYHVVHAPPYFWHTWRDFLKQDARGDLVLELVPISCSAFRQRFLI